MDVLREEGRPPGSAQTLLRPSAMDPIKPDPTKFLLPDEYQVVIFAKHQTQDYIPLPSIRVDDGRVASVWQPTPGELALLNEGVPVTVVQLTCGRPLQPLQVMVGGADLR